MLKTIIPTFVALVVLSSFLFLNADGHPVYLVRAPLYSHNPNFPTFPGAEINYKRTKISNWIHGWPIAGLLRVGRLPVGYNGELLKRINTAPSAYTSRWPFDNVPWYHTNYTAFVINALFMTIVTIDAFLFTRGLLANRLKLSISMLMAGLLIVSVVLSLRVILFVQLDWLERTAVAVVVGCGLITAIRLILGSIRMAGHRLQQPKNEPASLMY